MLTEKMIRKIIKFVQISFKIGVFILLIKILYYLNSIKIFTEVELQRLIIIIIIYLIYWLIWKILSIISEKIVTWEESGGIIQKKWKKIEWKKKEKWGKKLVWIYNRTNIIAYIWNKYAIEIWKFIRWFNWKFYKYEKFRKNFWKIIIKIIKFIIRINIIMYRIISKVRLTEWTTIIIIRMWAFIISLTITIRIINYIINYFEISRINFYIIIIIIGMILLFFVDDYIWIIKRGKFSIIKWYFVDADISMFLGARWENNLIGTIIHDVIFVYSLTLKKSEPYIYGKNCVMKEVLLDMKFEEEWFMREVKNKPSIRMHRTFVMNLNSFFKIDDIYVQHQIVLEYGKEKYKVKIWGKEEEKEFNKEKCKKIIKREKRILKKILFYLWDYEKYQGHVLTKAVEAISDNGLMYVRLTLNIEKYKNTEKDQFDDWKIKEDINEEHFFKDYNKLMYYASYKHSEDEHFIYEAHNDQFGDWGMIESFYQEEVMKEETKEKRKEIKEINKRLIKNCIEEIERWQREWEKEWEEGRRSYLSKN